MHFSANRYSSTAPAHLLWQQGATTSRDPWPAGIGGTHFEVQRRKRWTSSTKSWNHNIGRGFAASSTRACRKKGQPRPRTKAGAWTGIALPAAVLGDNEGIAKDLLKSRACVNARDAGGSTPLHYAVEKENQRWCRC